MRAGAGGQGDTYAAARFRSEGRGGRWIHRLGSVFGCLDSYGDVVAKGAFVRSLGEWRSKGRMPALLWQHDPAKPIGTWLDLREDDRGLSARGRLAGWGLGRDARTLLKDGAVSETISNRIFRTRNAKVPEITGIRTLLDLELMEIWW